MRTFIPQCGDLTESLTMILTPGEDDDLIWNFISLKMMMIDFDYNPDGESDDDPYSR